MCWREGTMDALLSRELTLFANRLIRHGLPIRYVQRVVTELQEHHVDHVLAGQEQNLFTSDQLDVLETRFVSGFRQRSFAGRFSFLVFPLVSLLMAPVSCFAYLAISAVFLVEVLPGLGLGIFDTACPPLISLALVSVVFQLSAIVPFLAGSALVAKLIRRSGRGMKWVFAATAIQIVIATITTVVFSFDPNSMEDSSAVLSIGTDVEYCCSTTLFVFRIVCQALMPMFVATLAWDRFRRCRISEPNLC